ncbi:MAG: DUF4360 domain-containing protein [Bdellovibrionaceae bacterium]|jgi:hypothetical protein|nr:DUF4360 domain-containing protein [Pseudobdellovibrionaceae bacterium]
MVIGQFNQLMLGENSKIINSFFRKRFWSSLIVAWISLLSLSAQAALLRIHRVTWQGSGCDFASVAATLSPDEREVSLLFDNYRIELESRSNLPQVRKDCLIELDIETSSRIQFAFRSVDYRGFASIPAGMEGFHRLAALLEGERVPALRENYLRGPIQQNYFQRVQATRLSFSRCGQTRHRVRIYSQLGLNRMRGAVVREDALIDLDSKDFATNQGLGLEIRNCF